MFRIAPLLLCSVLLNLCDSAVNKYAIFPTRDVCGKQEEGRIYGGTETVLGEFPWLALLEFREGGVHGFICGGVLINNRYILTAAHCIDNTVVSVRLGEHNLRTEQDCDGTKPGLEYCSDDPVDIEIEEKIVHENYTKDISDIALLRLKQGVNYTDYIKPICLPLSERLRSKSYVGSNVTVAGWGHTESGLPSEVKLKVQLPVVPKNACAQLYAKHHIYLQEHQLCAGGQKNKDSCNGDSGGPLMYRDRTEDEENWIAIGVVSFGLREGCGIDKEPGVYTKVSSFIDWIIEHIRP